MKNSRNGKVIAIIGLSIMVVGLSVGFSALSTRLVFNGMATVEKSSWGVEFQSNGELKASLVGDAKEIKAPELLATSIKDYKVSITSPGDSVTYNFVIKNTGTIDAKISTLTMDKLTCTGFGDKAEADAANLCNHLTYSFKYADGNPIAVDNVLTAGESKNVTLTLQYDSAVSDNEIPDNDVAITGLGITIVYVQK